MFWTLHAPLSSSAKFASSEHMRIWIVERREACQRFLGGRLSWMGCLLKGVCSFMCSTATLPWGGDSVRLPFVESWLKCVRPTPVRLDSFLARVVWALDARRSLRGRCNVDYYIPYLTLLCCCPLVPLVFVFVLFLFAVQDTPFHEACRHQYEGIVVSVSGFPWGNPGQSLSRVVAHHPPVKDTPR